MTVAVGVETEYGVLIPGLSSELAARSILSAYQHLERAFVPCSSSAERPYSDLMLANGARLYVDHGHPEYATPECLSPRQLTAADKAGERIITDCLSWLDRQPDLLPQQQRIKVFKNNCDYHHHSYGCHENYLLSRLIYEDLFSSHSLSAFGYLMPFLITRTLFCGAGKVGGENTVGAAGFQLSQRADFFESLSGPQTMYRRPLLNTRDEPHADPTRFRRLHVILGDANLAEFSTYLKIGTTQLILQMLEANFLRKNLAPIDPLSAFYMVSRDLTFSALLELGDGQRMSALDIQNYYLERAYQYLRAVGGEDEQWAIWSVWAEILSKLPDRWAELSTTLDWAIKRRILEHYLSRQRTSWDEVCAWQPVIEAEGQIEQARALASALGLNWHDHEKHGLNYFELRQLDIAYHDIRDDPTGGDEGLFYHMQRQGVIKRLLSDTEINAMITSPPQKTRAWQRGSCIARCTGDIVAADWEYLSLTQSGEADGERRVITVPLGDPYPGTSTENAGYRSADIHTGQAVQQSTAFPAAYKHEREGKEQP